MKLNTTLTIKNFNSVFTILLVSSLLLSFVQLNAQSVVKKPVFKEDISALEPIVKGSRFFNLHLGGTAFLGDLGGNGGTGQRFIKDLNIRSTRPFIGVSYTYYPDTWWSITGGIDYTQIVAADSLIKEKTGHALGRYQRNLNFKSSILEAQAGVEVYPIQLINDYQETKWRPYAGVGVGVFHFNPKAKLDGKWYELQPLHLEGQGFDEYPTRFNYKLTQMYIPVILGVRYRIKDNYLISLSAVFRQTFTDYIDDVSTTYIDAALFDKYLRPDKAALAKKLYYREAQPFDPQGYNQRGSNHLNDSYTSVFLSLNYWIK